MCFVQCYIDSKYESRVEKPLPIYIPRDEQFEESKAGTFSFCRLRAVLHNLLPSFTTNISSKYDFTGFKHIDTLFSEGLLLNLGLHDKFLKKLPEVVQKIQANSQGLLKFDTPLIISSTFTPSHFLLYLLFDRVYHVFFG